MVRFKVIKGSHLLLSISVLVLAVVIAFILLQASSGQQNKMTSFVPIETTAAYEEAKACSAFASSPSGLHIEIIRDSNVEETAVSPSILIYHTHTHEAFLPDEANPYIATEAWRTDDPQNNVVFLGSKLAEALKDRGYQVIHDSTDHEQDDMGNAYVRAQETLEKHNTDYDLIIDLHRDAFADGMLPCLEFEETEYAQIMMLVGKGDDFPEEEKPDYSKNLALSQKITHLMNEKIPGICRNVTVKSGRYNQHFGKSAILVEVGHNQNTMAHALNSIPYLTEAISTALQNINNI